MCFRPFFDDDFFKNILKFGIHKQALMIKCAYYYIHAGGIVMANEGNVKLYAILAYICPLWIIGLLVEEKNNELLRFHVNQGIVLTIIGTIASIITCGIASIPWLIFAIIGIMNANKEEMKPLPLIGGIKILK